MTEDRYAIGRDGVFATLYDRQEKRLIVENADEAHCIQVRDRLLDDEERHVVADDSDDPEHVDDCPGCATGGEVTGDD